MFANGYVGMSKEVVSNLGAAVNHHVRQQGAVLADLDASINHHIRAYGSTSSDLRRSMDDGRGVDTSRIRSWLIEKFGRPEISILRIFGTQCRLVDRGKTFLDNNGGSPGASGRGCIFCVGDKCDLTR